MTRKTYANKIAELVGGEVKEVSKPNGIVHTGIVVSANENGISPVIYIDEYYDANTPVSKAASLVQKASEEHKDIKIDISWVVNYEKVVPNLQARLYNESTKADVYLPAAVFGFKDLIIVPYILIGKNAYAKVTKGLLKCWNISETEVISAAVNNSNFRIFSMTDIIPFKTDSIDQSMYVVTNEEKEFGAFSIIKARQKLSEIFTKGYVALPSSVHEFIVIPRQEDDDFYNACRAMVRYVNIEHVAPDEKLSDNIYIF